MLQYRYQKILEVSAMEMRPALPYRTVYIVIRAPLLTQVLRSMYKSKLGSGGS